MKKRPHLLASHFVPSICHYGNGWKPQERYLKKKLKPIIFYIDFLHSNNLGAIWRGIWGINSILYLFIASLSNSNRNLQTKGRNLQSSLKRKLRERGWSLSFNFTFQNMFVNFKPGVAERPCCIQSSATGLLNPFNAG